MAKYLRCNGNPSHHIYVPSDASVCFMVKVIDCRICGDPHSALRFALVEFDNECKKKKVGLISSSSSPNLLCTLCAYVESFPSHRWCKCSSQFRRDDSWISSSRNLALEDCYHACQSFVSASGDRTDSSCYLRIFHVKIVLKLRVNAVCS